MIGLGLCLSICIVWCAIKSRRGGYNAGQSRHAADASYWIAGSSTATTVPSSNSASNGATQGPRAVFNLRPQQTPLPYFTNQYAQATQPGPSIPTNSSLQEAPPPSYEAANAYSMGVNPPAYDSVAVQQQHAATPQALSSSFLPTGISPAPSCSISSQPPSTGTCTANT